MVPRLTMLYVTVTRVLASVLRFQRAPIVRVGKARARSLSFVFEACSHKKLILSCFYPPPHV
jgi:hypothetical protein